MDTSDLLCKLLDCGYADVGILDDVEYDVDDIFEELEQMGYEKPDINNVMYAVFCLAKRDVQDKINEIKEEKQSDLDDAESTLEDMKSSLEKKQSELEDANSELEDLQDELSDLESELEGTEDEEEKSSIEEQIEDINSKISKLESEISELEEEVSTMESSVEEQEDTVSDLQREVDDLDGLEPQEDIESFHNYLDTSIYLSSNEEIYKKYDELNEVVEENTGFSLW